MSPTDSRSYENVSIPGEARLLRRAFIDISAGSGMPTHTIALVAITFAAAVVNGALGYGFSSITVPLALRAMRLDPVLALRGNRD
jgi:hypothetical protein